MGNNLSGLTCNGIQWVIDPLCKFSKVLEEVIINSVGLIPTFVTDDEGGNAIDVAVARYQYGGYPLSGGKITEDGSYKYPGDPVLYPIAQCVLPINKLTVYIYSYGMTAFVNNETKEHKMYRFD